jgi:Flp pilus assembly protein TadD
MRLAANALLLDGTKDRTERAIAAFLDAKKNASGDRELGCELALARGYQLLRNGDALLPIAEKLLAQRPDSDAAFMTQNGALIMKNNFGEAEKRAEERLKQRPHDPAALRVLAGIAQQKLDYERGETLLRQVVDAGKADANDFNGLAWLQLFEKSTSEKAAEDAQQAVTMSGGAAWGILHTQAAIFAELGKPTEARQIILQTMDIAGREEPSSEDWYVFGRIAETYGESGAAIAAYRKVEQPKSPEALPLSTYTLAQKRLKALSVSAKTK